MRCSTVWGLLEVAAAAAGGLPVPPVCAQVEASVPAISAVPAREAIARERTIGVNRGKVMNGSFQKGAATMRLQGNVRLACRVPLARPWTVANRGNCVG
jgi:hypothetical protein